MSSGVPIARCVVITINTYVSYVVSDINKNNIQVLLFSATFDDAVKAFVSKIVEDLFVHEYNKLFVKKEEQPLECVKQYKVNVPDELSKVMVVKDKIMDLADKVVKAIIFVHTRRSAGMLHKALVDYGFGVTTIHGGFTQKDRDTIIKEFKDGLTKVLISTDLLNRGFDDSKVCIIDFLFLGFFLLI